jgi:hypothetical protein
MTLLNTEPEKKMNLPSSNINSNLTIENHIAEHMINSFLYTIKKYGADLEETNIIIRSRNISPDIMRSRASFYYIFHKKENREYIITISSNTNEESGGVITNLTRDEQTGWIAHELGHIEEYKEMTNLQLSIWNIKYLFALAISYINIYGPLRKIERGVDLKAIKRGFGLELAMGTYYTMTETSRSDKSKERYSKTYTSAHESIDYAMTEYVSKINGKRK